MKNSLTERKYPMFLTKALCLMCSALFLLTASCSSKVVKKDEVFDPEKYLETADKLVSDKEYDEARKIFLEVKNRDTSKKFTPLAHLRIAESYIKEGEPDLGIAEYRKFLEFYPDNQYASHAQYQIAMAYFSQIEAADRGSGEAEKALREFLKLKELYPRNPYREVLDMRIEKCRTVIADGEVMVGEFYFKKDSYDAAIKRLEGVLKKFPDYKRGDEVLMLLYKSYKAQKNNDKAKEIVDKMVEKYPSSRLTSEAKKGIKGK